MGSLKTTPIFSIAKTACSYPKFGPFGIYLKLPKFRGHNSWVWVLVQWLVIVGITITYDKQVLLHQASSDHCSFTLTYIKLFGSSQHHCHQKQCLLLPHPNSNNKHLPYIFLFGGDPTRACRSVGLHAWTCKSPEFVSGVSLLQAASLS